MNQVDADGAVSTRFEEIATIIAIVAVIGIAYVCERAYRRWSREVSPLTAPRARVEHMRAGYRDRRETMSDVAEIVGAVLDEIGSSLTTGPADP